MYSTALIGLGWVVSYMIWPTELYHLPLTEHFPWKKMPLSQSRVGMAWYVFSANTQS